MLNDINISNTIYSEELRIIREIKFTRREIDIIAFFICGRSTKKAAAFFSISPKTVENHTHNIMLKVGCNSREGIIDFIEKSDKLSILRRYYTSLLAQATFEKCLKGFPKAEIAKAFPCLIMYSQAQDFPKGLSEQIERYLKLVGISITYKTLEEGQNLTEILKKACNESYVLYLLSKEENNVDNTVLSLFPYDPCRILFIFQGKAQHLDELKLKEGVDCIVLSEQGNVYFLVFQILKRLLPHLNVKELFSEFKKEQFHAENIRTDKKPSINSVEDKSVLSLIRKYYLITKNLHFKTKFFLAAILVAGFFGLISKFNTGHNQARVSILTHQKLQDEISIRSDLIIPTESLLLTRSELIVQIEQKFKRGSGIQTIAIAGIGGAGKSTLARYYASSQVFPVIWELNAETKGTLHESFENLAKALSEAGKDQKTLREILKLKDPMEQEEEIIQYVKKKLRGYSEWLLIFDNVVKFTDIQKYFPIDARKWGDGRIIITTRDSNIGNNRYVNSTIHIGELSAEQKQNLFFKIMQNGGTNPTESFQLGEAKKFIAEIPPFPLDVSVAAYYLKATNISYANYLDNLLKYNKNISKMQEKILQEAGDYTKTRFNIITLSLRPILEMNNDFKLLLLFISLLDSQNIPRDLLIQCKGAIVADNFIYNLKKYSLITKETIVPEQASAMFTLHRSTQAIILNYFMDMLEKSEREILIESLSNTLEDYISNLLDKEEFHKIKFLVNHCEMFLQHDFLDNSLRAAIEAKLGCILFYLDHFVKAQHLLEKSLRALTPLKSKRNFIRITQIYFCLGNINKGLGNYEKAKQFLETGLNFCKKYIPDNHYEVARGLLYLGSVYRYLKEYEKARDAHEKSLFVYKKYISEDHIDIYWISSSLGVIYSDLGDYQKAKTLLEQSLGAYETHYGKEHIKTAKILKSLGKVYFRQNQLEMAEQYYNKALHIFQKNKHSDSYRVFESLAEVYLKQAQALEKQGKIDQARDFTIQAIEYFKKALEILKAHFPEDSRHTKKVKINLKKLESSLYRDGDNL